MGKNQTKPFYFHPELKGMILCASVLEIVLGENPKAKELLADVKKCCKLPGCENPFELSDDLRKSSKELINKYRNRTRLLIWLNNTKRRDLNKLRSIISTFVKVEFNRESEKAQGKYRVNGNVQSNLANSLYFSSKDHAPYPKNLVSILITRYFATHTLSVASKGSV